MNLEQMVGALDQADADVKEAQHRKWKVTEDVTQALISEGAFDFLRIDVARMRRAARSQNLETV